ncbi:conserved hypothetical protein [Ricinus communis]|uniref:Uncharacterized protein n=1 Tax=Ricinus communis TaxID=3988 RepID=B9SJ76_RICCO|nr:conserved hypothetical protein [Ricinus communis]
MDQENQGDVVSHPVDLSLPFKKLKMSSPLLRVARGATTSLLIQKETYCSSIAIGQLTTSLCGNLHRVVEWFHILPNRVKMCTHYPGEVTDGHDMHLPFVCRLDDHYTVRFYYTNRAMLLRRTCAF